MTSTNGRERGGTRAEVVILEGREGFLKPSICQKKMGKKNGGSSTTRGGEEVKASKKTNGRIKGGAKKHPRGNSALVNTEGERGKT